ncbi:MAG TPA: penicillin-binding transpeptidase domain-containing protein [Candidatus Babeliales bacterium]|nr:penicillin-binding transpeptidase domain-containing protein [Candidatus Babeliales bacterium]
MHISTDTINKKIICILIGAILSFVIICLRLFFLQIYCGDYFAVRSQKNFIRYTTIYSPRGSICDIHGNLLATNRPVTTIYWKGTGNKVLSHEQLALLHLIEEIVQVTLTTGTKLDLIVLSEKKNKKTVLISDIDSSCLGKLMEIFPNHENILIETNFKRFYPYHSYGSHVVGYLGDIAAIAHGKLGLEKLFDENLSGKKGSMQNIVNSAGQCISQVELEKALIGNDVQTTINIDIQVLCEKIFPDHRTGSLILLNPANGAIASLVSRPNFDPNIFLDPISYKTWQDLQEKNPFLNRVFDASYPSGSIFKLVVISAALECGIINEDSLWNCKGYTFFGNRKYWCARRSGHGEISIKKAVAESCNTLFFEIGKQIDIDVLAEYAHKFGLGKKTNIIFPEKMGLIPSREWKFGYKGECWWPGETLSVAIGQSFLLVTPIQIACMIGSIFTGYHVTPRLLIDEPIIMNNLNIKAETITFLKKSMKSVVKSGTGRSVRKVKDITIYAKTSTAQTSDFSKRKLDEKYLEHGWFVAYFQYKDYDPMVIVILVERVGTAQVATNIAKNFLIEYKKYMDLVC